MAFHYPINGGGGGGDVTSVNGQTGDVILTTTDIPQGDNLYFTGVSVDGTSVTGNGLDVPLSANFTQMGKYMISGGAVWSGTGLTYDVSIVSYFFNGMKSGSQATVTLDPSDPTFNRLDSIVIDEAGTISVITGIPSSSPVTPPIPEDQLEVQIVLVEAGSTTPTVATESIYLDDPTTDWTFSTYTTGAATGTIDFAGTNSPKQGVNDIEASTDARLGARFVRTTSFDPYQYTMMSVWVRFTGTAVATNKSLNVRFENSAGTLVGNTVNLFSFGLSRSILNTWQLVVVPITAFGALPATVKGLKVIMTGGTVGVVRQWDLDYMILTNGSVPQANVPTIVFAKDGTNIASQSGVNLIEGTGVTINAVNNPTNNRVDYTINSSGGGTPAGSNNQIQINQSGSFFADSSFQKSDTGFNVGLDKVVQSAVTFAGAGLDDLIVAGAFSGTAPTTYTVTIDGVNKTVFNVNLDDIVGGSFAVGQTITTGANTATIDGLMPNTLDNNLFMTVTITSGSFNPTDIIDNGSGVTAPINQVNIRDTFSVDDGTTVTPFVPIFIDVLFAIVLGSETGHTLSDSWTWTYSIVNQNVLDFSENDYKFQSTFGDETLQYQITDNLLGSGKNAIASTFTVPLGSLTDFTFSDGGDISSQKTLSYPSVSANTYSQFSYNRYGATVTIGTDQGNLNITSGESSLTKITDLDGINQYKTGFRTSGGSATIGDIDGGNNTKITVDDENEIITLQADNQLLYKNSSGNNWLNVNPQGSTVGFGDLSNSGNGNKLVLDDTNNEITLATSHTQQSAVSFTGSGLDDLAVGGLFSGTVPTTYTVTIDGVNQEFLIVDTSTISGGTFAVSDTVTNGTGGSADIVSISVIGDNTCLRVTINSGSFSSADVIDNGSGVTGTLNNNQTTYDTITYTDGVVTETNYPITNQALFLNNGIVCPMASTGHTLTDEWTWTYSYVNQNVLDFSNNDYKFQSVLGTDTFGYQIGDNLLGFGIKGALNTYSNTGGDFGLLGFASSHGTLDSTNQLYFSGGERALTYLAKNQYDIEVDNGTDKFLQSITPVTFSYINTIGGIEYGISQSAGVTTLGNLSSGNNTKITIDDVNEQITISNLSAYDDDTAAGVGGLTAGMLYMTTGSGAAPLNVAGILMIKQ